MEIVYNSAYCFIVVAFTTEKLKPVL